MSNHDPLKTEADNYSFQAARDACRALGFSLTRTHAAEVEYRLAFRGPDAEASAYYTNDLGDAIATARRMVERSAANAS